MTERNWERALYVCVGLALGPLFVSLLFGVATLGAWVWAMLYRWGG